MKSELENRKRDALAAQIEAERLELKNAPVINVITDAVLRCHGCGKVSDQLYELHGPHNPKQKGRPKPRMMCGTCHPDVRAKVWAQQ